MGDLTMARADRDPAFHGVLLTQVGRRYAFEFCCLGCHRRKMIGPAQLPDSVRDRADKLRVRDLESISHCTACRRARRKPAGVRVDVVPAMS